jgi:transposase
MYSQYVGIDISANNAQVEFQPGGLCAQTLCIDYTPAGLQTLCAALDEAGVERCSTLVVMEATGVYWMKLATQLYQAGFVVSVINPAQAHYFARALLQRSKTDVLDAHTLTVLAAKLCPAPWQPASDTLEAVYQRLRQREVLQTTIQQERNRRHSLLRRPMCVQPVLDRLDAHILFLQRQITDLDSELKLVIAADASWQHCAFLLRSIKGFGPVVTHWLLTATRLFTACQTPEQLASYAGLVPRFFESGSSIHSKPALGFAPHDRLRQALYMASLSAVQHNPVIRAYYLRLLDSGKPKKVALCACARKLIHIAWAVVMKQCPFDPDFALLAA